MTISQVGQAERKCFGHCTTVYPHTLLFKPLSSTHSRQSRFCRAANVALTGQPRLPQTSHAELRRPAARLPACRKRCWSRCQGCGIRRFARVTAPSLHDEGACAVRPHPSGTLLFYRVRWVVSRRERSCSCMQASHTVLSTHCSRRCSKRSVQLGMKRWMKCSVWRLPYPTDAFLICTL